MIVAGTLQVTTFESVRSRQFPKPIEQIAQLLPISIPSLKPSGEDLDKQMKYVRERTSTNENLALLKTKTMEQIQQTQRLAEEVFRRLREDLRTAASAVQRETIVTVVSAATRSQVNRRAVHGMRSKENFKIHSPPKHFSHPIHNSLTFPPLSYT
jgi:DNA-directed RNA polymerase subunit F